MVKNDNIRIKRRKPDFMLYGFSYLFLILAGIFLVALPFLPIAPPSELIGYVFMGIGALFSVSGLILYIALLYRGIRPKDALVITNKGFTNYWVGGKEGVYVEWVNIASMKVFGLTKAPMLGLTLSDTDTYLDKLDGRHAKIAKNNLELGIPVIAISQREVAVKIEELKPLFSRMIKGAISWEQYAAHNKKIEAKEATPAAPRGFTVEPDHLTEKREQRTRTVEIPPVETAVETPAESPVVTPVETPAEAVAETPKEAVEESAMDELTRLLMDMKKAEKKDVPAEESEAEITMLNMDD